MALGPTARAHLAGQLRHVAPLVLVQVKDIIAMLQTSGNPSHFKDFRPTREQHVFLV